MNDPLAQFPGYVLRRASAAALAEIATRLVQFGLRPSEASILTLIAHNAGATQSDIGGYLGIKRANMTPIVGRLEDQGWVWREPLDGRSQALALTDAGRQIQRQVFDEVQAYERLLVERIPDEHRRHALPVLTALWGGS